MSVTLYDLPGRDGKSWLPMSVRIRDVLDYKGIPYNTVWLEYPDIEPTLRVLGAAPTNVKQDGNPFYTVPVISDSIHKAVTGEPTIVSDSWNIAIYIEETFPNKPALFPPGSRGLQSLFQEHILKNIHLAFHVTIIVPMHQNLNERSAVYFREKREAYYQKKLEAMGPVGSQSWQDAWDKAERELTSLSDILDKNGKERLYVMGDKITYADFILASVLETIIKFAPEQWEKKVKHWNNGRWVDMLGKCRSFKSKAE
ncbi:hypothetical protein BU17DRAFT_102991 [Hysterangium stoloniferum]|nr:hypothetical protein BU17DRAFT_102991 [Hysterangium stoloniferum]